MPNINHGYTDYLRNIVGSDKRIGIVIGLAHKKKSNRFYYSKRCTSTDTKSKKYLHIKKGVDIIVKPMYYSEFKVYENDQFLNKNNIV